MAWTDKLQPVVARVRGGDLTALEGLAQNQRAIVGALVCDTRGKNLTPGQVTESTVTRVKAAALVGVTSSLLGAACQIVDHLTEGEGVAVLSGAKGITYMARIVSERNGGVGRKTDRTTQRVQERTRRNRFKSGAREDQQTPEQQVYDNLRVALLNLTGLPESGDVTKIVMRHRSSRDVIVGAIGRALTRLTEIHALILKEGNTDNGGGINEAP